MSIFSLFNTIALIIVFLYALKLMIEFLRCFGKIELMKTLFKLRKVEYAVATYLISNIIMMSMHVAVRYFGSISLAIVMYLMCSKISNMLNRG